MGKANVNSQPEFFRAQAQSMREQANSAVLDNVRDRCLRSAEAWDEMASRAERHKASVAKTEAIKAQAAANVVQTPMPAAQLA